MSDNFLKRLNRYKHKLSYPNTLRSLLGQHRCSQEKELIKMAIELEKYKCAMAEQRGPLTKHKRKLTRMLTKGSPTTESWRILSVFVRCAIDETVKAEVHEYFRTHYHKKMDHLKSDRTQDTLEKKKSVIQDDKNNTRDQSNSIKEYDGATIVQEDMAASADISQNINNTSDMTFLYDKLPKYDSFFYDISLECNYKTVTFLGISLNFQTEYQYQEYIAGRPYGDLRSFNCQLIDCVRKIKKIKEQLVNIKVLKEGEDFSWKPLKTIGFMNNAVDKLGRYISFLENNLINCEQVKLLRVDCVSIREYLRRVVEPGEKIEKLELAGPLSSYIQNYSVGDVTLRNRLKKKIFSEKLPLLPVFYDLAFDHISFDG